MFNFISLFGKPINSRPRPRGTRARADRAGCVEPQRWQAAVTYIHGGAAMWHGGFTI